MLDIVFPVALFIFVAAILNGKLFLKRKYSYSEKAHLFIPILVVSSILLLTLYDTFILVPSFTASLLILLVVFIYLAFSMLWMRTIKRDEVVGIHTIPDDYHSIVVLNPLADTTKLFEIFFQDVVVLILVLSLTNYFDGNLIPLILFTFIAFIVHIPGIKFFGKIFGTYWLVLSTMLAPLAFYLISFQYGLYYLFMLHASITLFLYIVIYILSKLKMRKLQ